MSSNLSKVLLATDPPMKENPYEDVELHGHCLGKKRVMSFPSSPTSSIPDTPAKVGAWDRQECVCVWGWWCRERDTQAQGP